MYKTRDFVISAIVSGVIAFVAFTVGYSTTPTHPDTSVSSFNDGFADGMRNAHELGPAGTAAWLAAGK